MRLKLLYIIGFSLLQAWSLTGQSINETKQLAGRFYAQQNYEQALLTYQRVAFFTSTKTDPEVLSRIASCFYSTGDFTRALEYYDHAYFAETNPELKTDYLFQKVITYLETKNYHFALMELLGQDFDLNSQEHFRKELLLGISYFGLEQYEQAGSHLTEAIPAARVEAKDSIRQLFLNKKLFQRPNPKAALVLSVITPGLGQFYAGDIAGGINSFLLTGTLIGIYAYLTTRLHPIDAILTILPWFQRYYQGGFDHAERAAELERERRRNQIIQQTLDIISNGDQ
ncbi:MAG: tetratricopeptide repeat protein [Bacteroidales bacterium]|nr:tetratricopeptide repeat protein [Bacteroidales bacterium]